jgi:hypothetical protein
LLDKALSILKTKRMPDIEAKYLDGVHSPMFKAILLENGFGETIKHRMFLEVSQMETRSIDKRIAVKHVSSLLNWRALYLSSTTGQNLEESRKLVRSETPYGTIEEDDLTRLAAFEGEQMVGTIGYTTCRNVAYLEKLSIMPSQSNKAEVAYALVLNGIHFAERANCGYVVTDTETGSLFNSVLKDVGFRDVGQISYFFKIITLKTSIA